MLARQSLRASLLFLPISIVASAQDLTLEQILNKNEEALGGANALNKIQTLQMIYKTGAGAAEIIAKWAANAPLAMIHQYIPSLKKYRAIAFEVGDKDEYFVETTKALDQIFRDYGIEHTFEIYDGDHTNRIAARLETKVMPFFSDNLSFSSAK